MKYGVIGVIFYCLDCGGCYKGVIIGILKVLVIGISIE